METTIEARVAAALAEHEAQLAAIAPLAGGACQELFRVELADASAWVLRSDAKRSLPGSLDRRAEFAVVEAALAAGVLTPQPRWLSQGIVREGAWAYFLPFCEGLALGGKVTRGDALAGARAGLVAALAEQAARLHEVAPSEALVSHLGAPPLDSAQAALATLDAMAAALPTRSPAIELALAWLREHAPPPLGPVLTHGDFRVGNFLVRPEGLSAVLDWEFAHWGDPAEDLAWLCVRDWRFAAPQLAAGGLGTREALRAAYLAAGGDALAVEPGRLRFWEVYGNARWAVGARFQAERALSGGSQDLELLAIGRRVPELEYETLRQIGDSPPEDPLPALEPALSRERPSVSEVLAGIGSALRSLPSPGDRRLAFRLKIADALLGSLASELPRAGALEERAAERVSRALRETSLADASASDVASLAARLGSLAPEAQAELRGAILLNLSELLAWRNPRFDRSADVP